MPKLSPEVNPPSRRGELIDALNRVTREASGLGVLFGETVARHLGIAHSDLECSDIIAVNGRITAGDLARQSGLSTGAVTGVIDRLEAAGLAKRERDPDDRRKVYVRIVPKGMERAAVFYGPFGKAMDALAASYGDAEIALLIDYFMRTRDIIRGEIAKLDAVPVRKPRSPRR